MASLRPRVGKYANIKFHIVRVRVNGGPVKDIVTDIPVEPPGKSPGDPDYAEAKKDLEKLALEEGNDLEARGNGKMGEDEFTARTKARAKKLQKGYAATSCTVFIVSWVWEYVLRNRVTRGTAMNICNLMNYLLSTLKDAGCKTIDEIRDTHLNSVSLNIRLAPYKGSTVNIAVGWLSICGRALEEATGNALTHGLYLEAPKMEERMPFTIDELCRIDAAIVLVVPDHVVEWRRLIRIMLYTEMRPSDAARVIFSRIREENGIGLIDRESSKTDNFRDKHDWKPMHQCLQRCLQPLLDALQNSAPRPEAFILDHLAYELDAISATFDKIMHAAEIDPMQSPDKKRVKAFFAKTLYSLKHTSSMWLNAAGAKSSKNNKTSEKSGHLDTSNAQKHYDHSSAFDLPLLKIDWQRTNTMPDLDEEIERRFWTFSVDDIMGLPALINQLVQHSDALSAFLWKGFTTSEQYILTDYKPSGSNSKQAQDIVLPALNKVILGSNSFDSEQVAGVSLRQDIADLVKQNPTGSKLARLYRLILEDTYSLELRKKLKL